MNKLNNWLYDIGKKDLKFLANFFLVWLLAVPLVAFLAYSPVEAFPVTGWMESFFKNASLLGNITIALLFATVVFGRVGIKMRYLLSGLMASLCASLAIGFTVALVLVRDSDLGNVPFVLLCYVALFIVNSVMIDDIYKRTKPTLEEKMTSIFNPD